MISTSDDGVWPGSWSVAYGWPSTAYYAFGYDPAMKMVSWTPEGVVKNALLALAVAFIVSLGVLAARRRDS